jgi:hypothetical protein
MPWLGGRESSRDGLGRLRSGFRPCLVRLVIGVGRGVGRSVRSIGLRGRVFGLDTLGLAREPGHGLLWVLRAPCVFWSSFAVARRVQWCVEVNWFDAKWIGFAKA